MDHYSLKILQSPKVATFCLIPLHWIDLIQPQVSWQFISNLLSSNWQCLQNQRTYRELVTDNRIPGNSNYPMDLITQ